MAMEDIGSGEGQALDAGVVSEDNGAVETAEEIIAARAAEIAFADGAVESGKAKIEKLTAHLAGAEESLAAAIQARKDLD